MGKISALKISAENAVYPWQLFIIRRVTPCKNNSGGVGTNGLNCLKQQIFIADESSIISDCFKKNSDFISQNSLLADFVHFLRQGNSNNKIIFTEEKEAPPVLVEAL